MRRDLLGIATLAKGTKGATLATAIAIALLAGCSTKARFPATPWSRPPRRSRAQIRPNVTLGGRRAQVWVINHSEYKLQTVTDSIIQTDGPSGGKRALAYQITKTPSNEGTATIGFAAHCDNMLGCEPNPWKAGADFKQFVRGGPSQMGAPAGATATGNACRRLLPPRRPGRCRQPCPSNPCRLRSKISRGNLART